MSTYQHAWEFYRDTARLIAQGASLRALYDAMLTVQDQDMRTVDASPKRLREMAQTWSQAPAFLPIRLNELFNGLQLEHSDDYVLAMVGSLGGRWEQEVRLFMLRHDHALRDGVFWRMFEVEGGGEISLANIDKFSVQELNWHHTVVLLVKEGTLDRRRVLRACLEALNRDFSAYRAGWFSRMYMALAPGPDEAAEDQHLLHLCLGSSVTATVSLGVKQLEALHKAGLLEARSFVEASGGAFSGPKAAALPVLRILEALGSGSGVEPESIAHALALGLGHPHADVQRAAAKALMKLGRGDLVHAQGSALVPSVAAEVLPRETSVRETSLTEAALADAGSGMGAGVPPPEPLHPWTEGDALERYAALLENPSDAIEFELALAWLAVSGNAAAILAPLRKRASALAGRGEPHYPAALLMSAVEPELEFLPQKYWQQTGGHLVDGKWVMENLGEPRAIPLDEDCTALPGFIMRLREVAELVQGRAPQRPLLATPTDTQGWLGLEVLLARHAAAKNAAGPLPFDLAQALLRVRPEDRARATAATGGEPPRITGQIQIEWRGQGSDDLKADGTPRWVWWHPVIRAESIEAPSKTQPALIPSGALHYSRDIGMDDLTIAELALVHPASTLALAAFGVGIMSNATGGDVEHRAPAILRALAIHPGAWSAETAQLLALGLAATRAELRAQAAELLVAAIPARLGVAAAAEGFAACAPAVVLTRWAESFADAATLSPGTVMAVLTSLLPRLERKARGVGSLIAVLQDESLRYAHPVTEAALRDWLAGFSGASAASKAAKALLAIG